MDYEIAWTLIARSDLRRIVEYIADDNPIAAERFGEEIFQEVEHLSQFPQSGNDVPEKADSFYR